MIAAERIVRHYGGDWHGNQGNIPGEGHSAKDRSVSIANAPDRPDGVLVCVRGAGDWKAEMDRFRRDGLLPAFEPRQNGHEVRPMFAKQSRPAGKTYFEYQDADGVTTCRKVRTDPGKHFTWQHPDGAGGWKAGRGCEPLFYRLPDLLSAPTDAVVYFAEGEAKADKLSGWGLVATSSKDLPDDLSPLEGRTVVILPDNDAKGADIAKALAARLEGVAGRVVVVTLPSLPDAGDIIDWSGTVDDLIVLVDRAAVGETLQLADLSEWAKTRPSPKTFIVPGLVPEREVTLLTGDGGANKSTWGQQLVTVAAASLPMLGLEVQHGPAMYITAEDHFDRLHWMHAHICEAVGANPEALVGRLHIGSVRGVLNNELATFDSENRIRSTPAFSRLKATLISTGAKLLVLDNVAHMFAGNESDRAQVTAFVNLLYSLCLDLAITIILIAHRNKAGDSYSGSTAWLNAVRSHLLLERPEGGADPDERIMSVGKANYARPGDALRFRWHNFALIRDEDLPADTREEMSALLRFNLECSAFLECLRARASQGEGREVGPSPGPNYAPTQFEGDARGQGAQEGRAETGNGCPVCDRQDQVRDLSQQSEIARCDGHSRGRPGLPERLPEPQPELPRAHTLHTTYVSGAAQGSAAPDSEARDKTIFASIDASGARG